MIYAYIRVSTEKQNPDNQKEEIRRYSKENGMTVDYWICETTSGKTEIRKRKLGRLIRKMKKGDTLIVTEVSRLSRTLTEVMGLMGDCLKKGISIYTTKERYRFDDSINSKVLCFAFGLVAEIERNLISMRTKEALAVRKAEGVVLGRPKGSSPKMEILYEHQEEIRTMLQQEIPARQICRKYGVCRDTLSRFRKMMRLL